MVILAISRQQTLLRLRGQGMILMSQVSSAQISEEFLLVMLFIDRWTHFVSMSVTNLAILAVALFSLDTHFYPAVYIPHLLVITDERSL